MANAVLNQTSYPHVNSLSTSFNKNKFVCPLVNSAGSTNVGLILGNLTSLSGATPNNFTPLLNVYFSIPVPIPESIITASQLKAALAIPAKNLPLPASLAPIRLIIGNPSVNFNLYNISPQGKSLFNVS